MRKPCSVSHGRTFPKRLPGTHRHDSTSPYTSPGTPHLALGFLKAQQQHCTHFRKKTKTLGNQSGDRPGLRDIN